MLNLRKYGPWALVTGASGGIGEGFAVRLARDGFNVVLVARREERLCALAHRLAEETPHVQTLVVRADLSEPADVEALLKKTSACEIGLLVNNAGMAQVGSIFANDVDQQMKVVTLNCTVPLHLMMHFGKMMVRRGRGGIINISSRHAAGGNPICPLYCATKAFLSSLSTGLSDQLEASGVDVLVAQPGKTNTDIVQRAAVFNHGASGVYPGMPVDQCVSTVLAQMGRSDVVTVGWRAKLYVFIRTYLPRLLSRCLLDSAIERALKEGAIFPQGKKSG